MAIGQEIMVTFQQMVLPFAAVANGGIPCNPRIYERIESRNGEIIDSAEYRPVRRILSEDVASRLRVMLRKVVDEGTGKNAAIEGVSLRAKQEPHRNRIPAPIPRSVHGLRLSGLFLRKTRFFSAV